MNRYIIGYGRYRQRNMVAEVASVYAASIEAAEQRANAMSQASGLSAEEAGEPGLCWAEPWDMWLAADFGLAVWDEDFDARAAPMTGRPKDGWEIVEARK